MTSLPFKWGIRWWKLKVREGEEKEEIPLDGFFSPLYEKGELVYGMRKRQRFGKASVEVEDFTLAGMN